MADPRLLQQSLILGPGVGVSQLPRAGTDNLYGLVQSLSTTKLSTLVFPLSGLAASGAAHDGDILVWNGAAWASQNWVPVPFGVGQAPLASGGLTIALSGTPWLSGAPWATTTGPAVTFLNTQSPSGGATRIQFRNPASFEMGILDESNPFDQATVTARYPGKGNCWYLADLRQGTVLLDQMRFRVDGDGQVTIRTANANPAAVENNLRLVHTPASGLVASGGLGVGIQFGGLAHDFGTLNAVGSTVDATGGLVVSRFDFYTYGNGATTTSMTLSGDGTVFIPGKLSVTGTSRFIGAGAFAGPLSAGPTTVNSLTVTGAATVSGALAVAGATTLQALTTAGALQVNNNAAVTGTLTVGGATAGSSTGTVTASGRVRALGIYDPVLAPVVAFTPTATGADTAEIEVPFHPKDGTTVLTFNVRRLSWRCAASGSTSGQIRLEVSTGSGAFSPATVGSVTLAASGYEGSTTGGFTTATVQSGQKVRVWVVTLPAATSWTVLGALESTGIPPE